MKRTSNSFKTPFKTVKNKVCQRFAYLYGIKNQLNHFVVKVLVKAYIHSILDYCVHIWSKQTSAKINSIQYTIKRFLISFVFPSHAKKNKGKSFRAIKGKINISEVLASLNFLTFFERIDLTLAKIYTGKLSRIS